MAGKKDIVEQALKLVTGEEAIPRIKLRGQSQRNEPDWDAIMSDIEAQTDPHPFARNERIYNDRSTFDISPFGETLHLGDIRALKPNQGSGTELIEFLKGIADKHDVPITGVAKVYHSSPGYISDTERLADWYRKRGFEVGEGYPEDGYEIRYNPRVAKGGGGFLDDVVKMAGKVITGEGDNVTRLSDVKSVRARDALIKQLKSSINQVKSGYFQAGRQALIDRKSLDLHKSGMLPLQQGTIVTPPSTWDMPGDWRVSGYWYDEKDPRRFGYRLQNESGQTYDAAASDPRAGLRRDNPYTFGAGFKAYAGPNAAPPKPVVAPVETPSALEPPEVLDAINKEYESLFGSEDPFKPKAHGGRIAKGPGGWLDDVVSMAGKLVAGEGEQAAKTGIRAYQGSPHDFVAERLVRFPDGRTEYLVGQPDVLPDVPQGAEVLQDFPLGRMRMDKIGTGEGAQAYGHGLYFAEAEPVAESYRYIDARSDPDKVQYQGKPVTWYYEKAFQNKDRLDRARATGPEMSLANAKAKFWEDMMVGKHPKQVLDESLSEDHGWPELVEYAKKIKLSDFSGAELPGHMYEVNIAADPNTFLDWDKPLSEQPQHLLDVARPFFSEGLPEKKQYGEVVKGSDLYDMLVQRSGGVMHGPKLDAAGIPNRLPGGTKERLGMYLSSQGIPGIKYLDAGSRSAGDGTRNYVVFDDKLISIIRKYGIAGASAMLGYNLMEQLDSKQALAATMADQDYKAGQLSSETDDIDDALRVAKDVGGGIGPVFMTDAKGISYDIKGNIIPPEVTGPNPARSEATPEQVGQRAAQDPATFDALMERYAVPDQDIARYEATKAEVAKQPYETQQMTHVGAPPMRDVKVDMPLFGGEQKITQAPYNVASGLSGMAQTAYDFKTAPLYMTPWTAPIGAGLDVAEGVATADPLQASLAALGAPGKYAKAAIIGGSNYFMSPAEAQAGPARWFSKAVEAARAIPMNKMTGEQALAMLRKGTSPEELRWMGAEDFLSGQKSVSKDDLVAFLEKNRVQPTEIVLGGSNKPTRLENIDIIDIPSEIRDRHPEVYSLSNRVEELRNELVKLRSMPDQSGLDYYDNFRAVSQEFSKTQADLVRVKDAIRKEYVESIGGLGRPTKYENWSTAGGEGYKETLTTLGNKGVPRVVKQGNSWTLRDADNNPVMNSQGSPYWYYDKEDAERAAKSIYRESGKYKSSHWDDPDVLFHTRSQVLDVTPPGANRPYRAWNVDETQSDWGQAGRKQGFKGLLEKEYNQANNEFSLAKRNVGETFDALVRAGFTEDQIYKHPDFVAADKIASEAGKRVGEINLRNRSGIEAAPYVTSTEGWTDRSIKNQLDKALDADSDYFTWTPGDVHADRYSLDKHIGALQYEPMSQTLYAYDKKGSLLMQETATPDKLPDYIGKEAAEKLLATKTDTLNRTHILGGLDLKVGGEGMRGYYDNVYPKRVQEVIRKATGQKPVIETIEVQTANGPRKQLGIRLTDEMREKARFSDFKKGGRVTGGNTYGNDNSVAHALALTSEY